MIKTLMRKYSSLEQLQVELDQINLLLGYPDGNGTDTYANIPEPTIITDEEGNEVDKFWLLTATHDLQEVGNPDIPLVSIEVLNDGRITVIDTVVTSLDADCLVGNIKHCIADIAPATATQEVIDSLVESGNIVIYS